MTLIQSCNMILPSGYSLKGLCLWLDKGYRRQSWPFLTGRPNVYVGDNLTRNLFHVMQKGNPLLKHITHVPWEYGDVVADYHINQQTCVLYMRCEDGCAFVRSASERDGSGSSSIPTNNSKYPADTRCSISCIVGKFVVRCIIACAVPNTIAPHTYIFRKVYSIAPYRLTKTTRLLNNRPH